MTTWKYIVEIDMPDGDGHFSTNYIRDLIAIAEDITYPIRVYEGENICMHDLRAKMIATVNEPLLPPPAIPDEWEQFRREAAKDILCALCSFPPINYKQDVRQAINITDELIRQLKEDEK